nr:aldehyde dehydrogenase family protein [Bacillus sp. CMF12]
MLKPAAAMEKLAIGSGINNPDLGPVLNQKQFERIQAYLQVAEDDGIRVATGGKRQPVEGCESGYYLRRRFLTMFRQTTTLRMRKSLDRF